MYSEFISKTSAALSEGKFSPFLTTFDGFYAAHHRKGKHENFFYDFQGRPAQVFASRLSLANERERKMKLLGSALNHKRRER
jgi:hypothetical protein